MTKDGRTGKGPESGNREGQSLRFGPRARALSAASRVWLICIVLAVLPWRPALADLFTVPGVIVGVAANSSVEAKELAGKTAMEKAFQLLARRLVVPEDLAAVPQLSAGKIEPVISSVQVLDEVTTATTFDGRFVFRFDPAATRRLLGELGLRYTEVQSRPFVVVPVLGSGDAATLWNVPNPWRAAWEGYGGLNDSLVPIRVPLGDLQDVVAVDAERALAGDTRGLADLAANYESVGSLVAQAVVTGSPGAGGASLAITLTTYGENLGAPIMLGVTQEADETSDALFERGVITVVQRLEMAWKEANAIQYTAASNIRVRALATALQDWLLIRRNLEQERLVSGLRVLSLRRGEVLLDLTHRGSIEQLQRALAQRGLALLQAPGGWDLQLGGGVGGVQARPLPVEDSGGGTSAE